MIFNDIETDTQNKLNVLNHLDKVYYCKESGNLYPANMEGACVAIDNVDKLWITGLFSKYVYLGKNEGCEECREEKQGHILIQLSNLINNIGERY